MPIITRDFVILFRKVNRRDEVYLMIHCAHILYSNFILLEIDSFYRFDVCDMSSRLIIMELNFVILNEIGFKLITALLWYFNTYYISAII